MFRDMPRSKEKVVYCQNPVETAPIFTDWLKAGTWFEFPEVHIEIPKLLWMKFEEMAPSSSPYRSQTKLYCTSIYWLGIRVC